MSLVEVLRMREKIAHGVHRVWGVLTVLPAALLELVLEYSGIC